MAKKDAVTEQEPRIEHEMTTRTLPCHITVSEKLRFADQMARASKLKTEIEEEAKGVAADYKARAKAKENEMGRIGEIISTGIEHRTVEVQVTKNYTTGTVHFIRTDTNEEIDVRKMSQAEAQMELPTDGDGE